MKLIEFCKDKIRQFNLAINDRTISLKLAWKEKLRPKSTHKKKAKVYKALDEIVEMLQRERDTREQKRHQQEENCKAQKEMSFEYTLEMLIKVLHDIAQYNDTSRSTDRIATYGPLTLEEHRQSIIQTLILAEVEWQVSFRVRIAQEKLLGKIETLNYANNNSQEQCRRDSGLDVTEK